MALQKRRRFRPAVTGGRRPYSAVSAMLDGYFQQDFAATYGSPEEAARAFVRGAKPKQLDKAARQLKRFHEHGQSLAESEWRAAFSALGGAWQPASLDAIGGIASLLEESVPPRYSI